MGEFAGFPLVPKSRITSTWTRVAGAHTGFVRRIFLFAFRIWRRRSLKIAGEALLKDVSRDPLVESEAALNIY